MVVGRHAVSHPYPAFSFRSTTSIAAVYWYKFAALRVPFRGGSQSHPTTSLDELLDTSAGQTRRSCNRCIARTRVVEYHYAGLALPCQSLDDRAVQLDVTADPVVALKRVGHEFEIRQHCPEEFLDCCLA